MTPNPSSHRLSLYPCPTLKLTLLPLLLLLVAAVCPLARAFSPAELPRVGSHPSGLAYHDTPYFANALYNGGFWMEYAEGTWGTGISTWNSPQFDSNGCPKYLNAGKKLRAICYGLHINADRKPLANGRIVLSWQGNADIRLSGGATYLSAESNGPNTGSLLNGRRVYRYDGTSHLQWAEVHAIQTPLTDIKIWLADPAAPATRSLENVLWHPTFLERLSDANWGFIRFMGMLETNGNPQRDWSDRRPARHLFMSGQLNPRSPATGFSGNRGSGAAYEHLIDLANRTSKDAWICVPHLATDDYVLQLARLIRFGADANGTPYSSPQANPAFPPLHADRKIYLELSNEIWSNGGSFPQGNWAEEQANILGISKAQFTARRFAQIWRIFQQTFGTSDRIVRVGAIFTGNDSYSRTFLNELKNYGPTLSPAVEPDVIACTTYFGNGIQDWAHERAIAQAGTSDPWFYTTQTFGSPARPVSVDINNPYWTSQAFERHLDELFREWTRRLLSGDAREGGGFDAVGVGGGFDQWLRDLAQTTFAQPKPIIAYEGGPSLYTDYLDGGDVRDDGITHFISAANRRNAMADVYRIHLNMAKSRGLWSHVAFVDCGVWGKYGQWGHLEYISQPPNAAVKYKAMLDHIAEFTAIRHIDTPNNAVPQFASAHNLPGAEIGKPYSTEILTSGGDGSRTVVILGTSLTPGLSATVASDRIRVQGTPTAPDIGYLYARVSDQHGDPDWRTFRIQPVGGPGTLVESDFSGSNPSRNLPWTKTHVLISGLTSAGWSKGSGIFPVDGDGALVYYVNAPPNEVDSTLAVAIADNEHWSFRIRPDSGRTLNLKNAQVRFAVRRIDGHAPRRFALFASPSGFGSGSPLYTSPHVNNMDEHVFVASLPNTSTYASLTSEIEFRIVGYSGQWGYHKCSITAFKITADTANTGGLSTASGGGTGGGTGGGGGSTIGGSSTSGASTGSSSGGLQADYFANRTLTGAPALSRIDATVNHNWGSASPGAGVPTDDFSVRWSGALMPDASGTYTLQTQSDDGIRVWLNDSLIIDNWTDHAPTLNASSPLSLTAGQRYAIRIEYYERGGGAVARLQWIVPGSTTATVIPQNRLFPTASGTGLSAELFNNASLTGSPSVTRLDPQINFDFGSGAPASGLGTDNFSIRWSGVVEAPATGSYTFETQSDDGVRLWVNNTLVIDNWTDHAPTVNSSAPVSLTAGQRPSIRMEYYERGGGAVARLRWRVPNASTAVPIPTEHLYPSGGAN